MRSASPKTRAKIGAAWLAEVGITVTPELGVVLYDDAREKALTGGWQAGKSVEGAAEVWIELPFRHWKTHDGPCRYWFILPSYEDPHKEIDYLHEWAEKLHIVTSWHAPGNGACRLVILAGHVIIETRTGQNVAAIAGEPCCGVVVVEAGRMSEQVPEQAQGRILARDGWIDYTGTLEDAENHPRWAHYGEKAEAWYANPPGSRQRSFRLPTWANPMYVGGIDDPRIQALKEELDPFTFDRRFAGIPAGNQYPAYAQLDNRPRDYYLQPLPYVTCVVCGGTTQALIGGVVRPCPRCKASGMHLAFDWVDGAGGIDYGGQHPSAVTAITLNSRGDVWVRASRKLLGGDAGPIAAAKTEFTTAFEAWRWGLDPLQRWAASMSGADTEAVKMGDGSRDGRVGMLRSWLNGSGKTGGRIYFDLNGEGVIDLYEEMSRVHYVKNAAGQLVYFKMADDMTASLEDAIEILTTGLPPMPLDLGALTESEESNRPKTGPMLRRDRREQENHGRQVSGMPGRSR